MTTQDSSSKNSIAVTVLNALPHPVFMVSADGTFLFVNAAAEAFFQSSFAILKNRQFSWFLPDGSAMRTLVEQVQQTGSPVNEYKVDVSSPRLGGEKWVDVYVSPDGERKGSVVVLLQVRSMADTLDKQLTHRGAARTVTGLASMLAHEIKNPLSGIRGAAQLLEMHSDEDDRALTHLITDETDRIVRLVDRMEVFSDERPIDRDPVNVHSVLEHVKTLALSGFAKGINISEHYDPSLPSVYGNRDQLIQVFLNLIKNASEALEGHNSPEIILESAFRPGMSVTAPGTKERVSLPIALTVKDNGKGVPEDIIPYMFDPFVSSKPNGSGLGLALVAKIVGDHGGVISCDSQSTGTAFQVLMPTWSEKNNEG